MPRNESGHAIRLSVLRINRSCKPAYPAFTMSEIFRKNGRPWGNRSQNLCFRRTNESGWLAGPPSPHGFGAAAFARFARTDGLACRAVAREASEGWWSRSGSNRRPQACKARALPTELRPRIGLFANVPPSPAASARQPSLASRERQRLACRAVAREASEGWWARDELNVRPHAYQACALTT